MTHTQPLPPGPLVAWYGDDFTGSAAVMEVLSFAGYPSVLFFGIPTDQQLKKFAGFRGIGVAGFSRSKGVSWMNQHLPKYFHFLEGTGAPVRHYKVCSTLDSSPSVGSIGQAADIAMKDSDWAPVVLGAPEIGRYQVFGNLFARASDGIHRLDRHPTMFVHPVTPMDEGDVGLHLERQTNKKTGLIDFLDLKSGNAQSKLSALRDAGKQIITFDVIDEETLIRSGESIWSEAAKGLFAIGSQGLEYALVAAWEHIGIGAEKTSPKPLKPVDQVVAVSGSCSPVTADQIRHACRIGFETVHLNAIAAIAPEEWRAECEKAVSAALSILGAGHCPIVCTSAGPDDPSISGLHEAVQRSGRSLEDVNETIGVGLGKILNRIISQTNLPRVAIAGGDSSSFGAQQLGLYAVTAEYQLSPGAAVLVGHADNPDQDGLEISLKGGQMGKPNFFEQLRDGAAGTF